MVGLVGASVFIMFLEQSGFSRNASVAYSALASNIDRYKIIISIHQSCQYYAEAALVICVFGPTLSGSMN
jgi:hypothetical protein